MFLMFFFTRLWEEQGPAALVFILSIHARQYLKDLSHIPLPLLHLAGPVVIDVLNCPTTDIAFLPSTLMDQVAVFWSEPFALSNTVDGLANVESQTHTPGDLFPIPSLTTVVYTFEDSGATGQCVFNIRVGECLSYTRFMDTTCGAIISEE